VATHHVGTSALKEHLVQLGCLVGRPVERSELLSIEETNTVRVRSNAVERSPGLRVTIPFADRVGQRFQALIGALHRDNPSAVYLWTHYSNHCGLLQPMPLMSVNFGFEFGLTTEGVLNVLASDFRDELVLDWSRGDGQEVLEIELFGARWGAVQW
jgi:hypothetical protein